MADAPVLFPPEKAVIPAAGLGTRISFTQVYDNPILRTDLAYGFKDKAWQFSFSIGHYF